MSADEIVQKVVTSADGTPIMVYETGEGPPLVLVYGMLSDYAYWTTLLPYLRNDFRLYIVERRGRGESGDVPGSTPEREIEDVLAAFDAVEGPIDVFAHSSGAVLSLLATQRSPKVRRLILYEPPVRGGAGGPPGGDFGGAIEKHLAAGNRDEAVATFLRNGPRMTDEELSRLKEGPRWADLTRLVSSAPYDARLVGANDATTLTAASSTPPTLLLAGDTSPSWMIQGVESLATRLPQARYETLAGQGHSAVFTAPAMLAGAILRFLK